MLVSLIMLSMLTLQCGRFAHSFRPNWKRSLASRLRAVDYIFTSEQQVGGAVLTLKKLRPRLQVLTGVGVGNVESGGAIWASYSGGMQLDACSLEPQYIGSRGLDAEDTAQVWKQQIEDREQKVANKRPQCSYIQGISVYQQELDLAIIIVQTATNLVRSLQAQLVSSAVSKPDNTPVTVADLAVQALVLDTLQVSFPNDRFIAEEDSSLVRSDSGIGIKDHVLQILNTVAGGGWSDERLYAALDLTPANDADNDDRSGHRVWVLDPIDGTKGFLRGEHCCIALGLLVDGKTQLSVLGCPNLNLKRVLQNEADMCAIDKPFRISSDITLFPPDIGAIFFAVSGHGAYARSLGMVPGAACEVSVSTVAEAGTAVLCESAEGGFGDRAVTAKVAADLELQRDFTRIDGECAAVAWCEIDEYTHLLALSLACQWLTFYY